MFQLLSPSPNRQDSTTPSYCLNSCSSSSKFGWISSWGTAEFHCRDEWTEPITEFILLKFESSAWVLNPSCGRESLNRVIFAVEWLLWVSTESRLRNNCVWVSNRVLSYYRVTTESCELQKSSRQSTSPESNTQLWWILFLVFELLAEIGGINYWLVALLCLLASPFYEWVMPVFIKNCCK